MTIDRFQGDYRWLSNFHEVEIEYEGVVYPTTEHAYQAAKTLDFDEAEEIRLAKTPGKARRLGQRVTMRPNWDVLKIEVMRELTRLKFQNPGLREKLICTGRHHLIEGAPWGDKFWGVCDGEGENHLGRILMDVRAEILKEER